ncbi:MAG TPA: glyceraldehyde 3-phosphate dehydrogenase NAD-binding domain-containing protein [Anaerolineales bacterium]|nr:glyceraldehyde 3-phosphate dehydrogenase NAD-binding domain-containing protein [Anaerolineales bacterium]
MAKVAINGFGRIGRAAFKIVLDTPKLEVAAVNDIVPPDNLAYLLKYDTVYGRYGKSVRNTDHSLIVDEQEYPVYSIKDPAQLPWEELGVDIVIESTGRFTKAEDLKKHIEAGAKYVILSAPVKGDGIGTVVHGVHQDGQLARIISCASCTTNAITPAMEIMNRRIGVKKALLTAIHAYTASQGIVDSPNKKFRSGRAAAANFVPASTGAAIATTKALPELEGKFDGQSIRGPVTVGSIADITFVAARPTSVEEVNQIFREEAQSERYAGILGASDEPLVSSDIIQDTRAGIIDLDLTQVIDGDLVKIMSWYDNEWGYTSQLIRETARIAREAKDIQ